MSLRNRFEDPFDDPFFENSMGIRDNMVNPFARDPFFSHTNGINAMTNSMMGHHPLAAMESMMNEMMAPFRHPMLHMQPAMANFGNLAVNPNCHTYTSSSLMTYSSSGNGGQPQIYQASSSTRSLPNGVKETRQSVRDSVSGVQKMAIGHHINDRSHTIQESRNVKTGAHEKMQNFVNLAEEDAEEFNSEWQHRTRSQAHAAHGIGYQKHHSKRNYKGLPSTDKVNFNRQHKANASKEYVPPTPPRGGYRDYNRNQDLGNEHSRRVHFNRSNSNRRY